MSNKYGIIRMACVSVIVGCIGFNQNQAQATEKGVSKSETNIGVSDTQTIPFTIQMGLSKVPGEPRHSVTYKIDVPINGGYASVDDRIGSGESRTGLMIVAKFLGQSGQQTWTSTDPHILAIAVERREPKFRVLLSSDKSEMAQVPEIKDRTATVNMRMPTEGETVGVYLDNQDDDPLFVTALHSSDPQ